MPQLMTGAEGAWSWKNMCFTSEASDSYGIAFPAVGIETTGVLVLSVSSNVAESKGREDTVGSWQW